MSIQTGTEKPHHYNEFGWPIDAHGYPIQSEIMDDSGWAEDEEEDGLPALPPELLAALEADGIIDEAGHWVSDGKWSSCPWGDEPEKKPQVVVKPAAIQRQDVKAFGAAMKDEIAMLRSSMTEATQRASAAATASYSQPGMTFSPVIHMPPVHVDVAPPTFHVAPSTVNIEPARIDVAAPVVNISPQVIHMPEAPAPIVQLNPHIDVHVPEQPTPIMNFSPQIDVNVEPSKPGPAPVVNVNVPQQAAPIVNVEAPVVNVAAPEIHNFVPVPEVNINVEAAKPGSSREKTVTHERDHLGNITRSIVSEK